MFNLHLTPEQLEFRDTVRDFVQNEVKPAALAPQRLEPFEKPLLDELVDQASHMGLRTLALSENAGGAGADTLTSCIVLEELAAGDVDLAVVLGLTSMLGHVLFDRATSRAQRERFLPQFLDDRRQHIAIAGVDCGGSRGWSYHRSVEATVSPLTAVKQLNGDWLIDGLAPYVPNAPLAKLFVVQANAQRNGSEHPTAFMIPAETPGFTVGAQPQAVGTPSHNGAALTRWQHGVGAPVQFKSCRVSAESVLGAEGESPFSSDAYTARSMIELAAINLGVGRAAHEAAIDYAKIRVQGGRPIIQHQSIGSILADIAVQLEAARSLIWKAAWASDHPEAVADRSVPGLPLHVVARTFTAEAVHDATLGAAECFGAMGVMRDMPMQKYVHDAMVLLHAPDHDSASKLEIAEALAGFQRSASSRYHE